VSSLRTLCVGSDVLFSLGYRRPGSQLFRVGFASREYVESTCTIRLAPRLERATNGCVLLASVPSSWAPCSSRWCQWWRLRHRSANAA
jgi:hypothetical protein